MKRKEPDERSLFDEVEGGAPCLEGAGESPAHAPYAPRSEWTDVPLAEFLSWSEKAQLEHCADRDVDSAEFADDPDDAEFFLARAKWYIEAAATLQ